MSFLLPFISISLVFKYVCPSALEEVAISCSITFRVSLSEVANGGGKCPHLDADCCDWDCDYQTSVDYIPGVPVNILNS